LNNIAIFSRRFFMAQAQARIGVIGETGLYVATRYAII
jgi:hypothetical protein